MNLDNSVNKYNIGDLILVNNKDLGIIDKIIWNSNGFIIKLQNNPEYIDKTLSQYKLIEKNNIKGYMLVTLNDIIKKVNENSYGETINQNQIINTINSINFKYLNFLKKLKSGEFEINGIKNYDDIYKFKNFSIYNYQAGQEDNYVKYITKMINDLFINEIKPTWNENFFFGEDRSIDILGEENINDFFRPNFIELLERFDPIDISEYYDFKNTLMYKHLVYDDDIDTLSIGKEIIKKIKKILIDMEKNVKTIDGYELLDITNLFDFLTFSIVGGYIEISNNTLDKDYRTIDSNLIPGLIELEFQYSKPIDYNLLTTIVLKNKTLGDINFNSNVINEALKILSQEYIVCLQPKVEALLWVICRLIICWYADPNLYSNIGKIKILINLFRARGLKEFNKDQGISPIIQIFPKYGKKIATKIMSHLSYFFFPYKKIGWETSKPSYFNKIDNLMYYTNGSLELKKYIQYLLRTHQQFNNPMITDMTQINTPGIDNGIEIDLPNIQNI